MWLREEVEQWMGNSAKATLSYGGRRAEENIPNGWLFWTRRLRILPAL